MAAENPNFSARPKVETTDTRHLSEPAVFVAKVAKRQKNPLTFSCNRQQAHQNIQNIKNNRSFGKRRTYLFRDIILFRNIPNERALIDSYS